MWASIHSVVRVFSDSVPDSEDRSALLGSRGAKQMPLISTFERAINSKGGIKGVWGVESWDPGCRWRQHIEDKES